MRSAKIGARFGVWFGVWGGLLGATSGCSLVTSFEECASAADCVSAYGEGTQCADGICAPPSEVSRLGEACAVGLGAVTDGGALVFGAMVPEAGASSGDQVTSAAVLWDGMRLAVEEINAAGGVNGRQVAVIGCEGDDPTAAVAHLGGLGVRGQITLHQGAALTASLAGEALTLVASPADSAEAASDKVWYTAPTPELSMRALGQLIDDVVASELGGREGVTLMLVTAPGFEAQAARLKEAITAKPAITEVALSDAATVAAQVKADAPELVVLLGDGGVWQVIGADEDLSASTGPRYLLGPGAFDAAAAKQALTGVAGDAGVNARVLGVRPQWAVAGYLPYVAFTTRYRTRYTRSAEGAPALASAYDAVYALALGVARQEVSGGTLASAMPLLSAPSGAASSPGVEEVRAALQTIASKQAVNFDGAGSALEFDARGHLKAAAVALWCRDSAGALAEVRQPLVSASGAFTSRRCDN